MISLITDRRRYEPGRMLATVAAATAAGVGIVQVRERDLDDRSLLDLVRGIMAVAAPPSRVVVNERADVALAASAAGVHLRADSVAASEVRRIAPADFLIGRSIHSVREAEAAAEDGGCDYLLFGTVFPSGSKPAGHRVAGLSVLSDVCRALSGSRPLPVLAVGGVCERHAAGIAHAGAAGVAGIELFITATDLPQLVAALRAPFDSSRAVVSE